MAVDARQDAAAAGGRTILLLHGQPGTGRDLGALAAAIGDRARVLAIDRPGWDGRTRAGGLQLSADAALAALDRAGAAQAIVVGHSYGAGVAAWLAADHPGRVAGLVLVSPSANTAALVALDRWLALPVAGYLASAGLLTIFGLALASARVRRRLTADLAVDDAYLRGAGRWLCSRAVWDAFAVEQRALLRDLPLLEARLGAIAAPTSIVMGAADAVVPPRAARRLAQQIPGAELIVIAGGRHLLPAQFPHRLAEVALGETVAAVAHGG
jgi:pimeloyl-ACP methyl ester carboxylesterase